MRAKNRMALKKAAKQSTEAPPIYPDYYGEDAYRPDVYPMNFNINRGVEPLTPTTIQDLCVNEAKKSALFGLPPKRKNSRLWQNGITEKNSTQYAWNQETVIIAAAPFILTNVLIGIVVIVLWGCIALGLEEYIYYPSGLSLAPTWVYLLIALTAITLIQLYFFTSSLFWHIKFNRRTGLVYFPRANKGIPFHQCRMESYWGSNSSLPNSTIRGGGDSVRYMLFFNRGKMRPGFIVPSLDGGRLIIMFAIFLSAVLPKKLNKKMEDAILRKQRITYGFIQQYMDITKPLPDIPALEPFRRFDPTTREHDEKTGRDPYFWRHMSRQDMKKFGKEKAGKSIRQA